ncbi:MAG: co-chaperone DjlA [Gammaproteobacteria bacterium]|nr:co-chaperone DjlA [Gammaproteobacteria bacterium]MBT8109231.1 co-chaperone DjlA [Gammaproteobacteria bacterium]NND46219.1 co-chaperone DjlA [Woeseiaceae bacterium]NNL43933.1 co-chaperone DjlA [Woeseiaceae bacterium]
MALAFIGAIIGLLTGGLTGLLVGGIIGYLAGNVLRRTVIGGLRVAQTELIESVFAVMGAICKADSVVSRDEIKTVEHIFGMLRLTDEQRRLAKSAFSEGKQAHFDLDAAVDRFAAISRRRAPLLQLFLQLQCMAVAADGQVHPKEHAMLVRVAGRLGLTEADVAQLESLLRAATAGAARDGTGRPPQDRLADAYVALGVTPDAAPADIKRAYRKLMSMNHPDKLAARGLPESMRAVAEERSREINAAYDLIKSTRGFV